MSYDDLSIFNRSFWDLWVQKLLRNIASVKYQWLAFLYVPVVWGMFNLKPGTNDPWISSALGLGFLGGGFITLATSRMIVRTKLMEDDDKPYYRDAKKEIKRKIKQEKEISSARKKVVKSEEAKRVSEIKAQVARQNLKAYRDGLLDHDYLDTDT